MASPILGLPCSPPIFVQMVCAHLSVEILVAKIISIRNFISMIFLLIFTGVGHLGFNLPCSSLSYLFVRQAVPDSLAGLQNLQELYLSSNLLLALPESIGLLLRLKILDVSGNKLKALPDGISSCRYKC